MRGVGNLRVVMVRSAAFRGYFNSSNCQATQTNATGTNKTIMATTIAAVVAVSGYGMSMINTSRSEGAREDTIQNGYQKQPRENGLPGGWWAWGFSIFDRSRHKEVTVELPTDRLVCHRQFATRQAGLKRIDRGQNGSQAEEEDGSKQTQPVVLVACGSFNPPTYAHLRVLELVRQEFMGNGVDVWGAYVSPVSDSYGKATLIPAKHRLQMCELAIEESDFIMVDHWEARQPGYTRTLKVLKSIDSRLLKHLTVGADGHETMNVSNVPRTVLVCGADMLESMIKPGVWDQELLEELLSAHGVACVTRSGVELEELVEVKGTLLHKYRDNITIVENPIPNEISSTLVRMEIQQGNSVKYLIPDRVLEYIISNKLYHSR